MTQNLLDHNYTLLLKAKKKRTKKRITINFLMRLTNFYKLNAYFTNLTQTILRKRYLLEICDK